MTFERRKKPTLKKMTVKLGLVEDAKFDSEDLINLLFDIPFSSININLNMKKSDMNMMGKGYTPIGFVNKFYTDEQGDYAFDVVIFEKFKDNNAVNEEVNELYIVARAFTNKEGKISKIISLDLVHGE